MQFCNIGTLAFVVAEGKTFAALPRHFLENRNISLWNFCGIIQREV